MLMEVNGIKVLEPMNETVKGILDRNETFSIKQTSKIRITKTIPRESIFIKVKSIFKREK